VYGLTWSYFQLSGVVLTSRLAKKENRSLALGLYNALAGAGWIVAGLASGLLTRFGSYELAFAGSVGLLILSLAVLRTVPDPEGIRGEERSRLRKAPAAPACPASNPVP
ncbi:hypothetical protein DRJ12_04285, partial [Candidatus Acetothermia bacterium]